MTTFGFWYKWLFGVSIVITIFGCVLAFFPQSSIVDFAINNQVDPVFWENGQVPDGAARFQAWVYGVLGATIAGWGIFMMFLIRISFSRRNKWAWNCIAASFAVWYVIDSSLSAYFGVFFNVLFNTALLIVVALPLIFTRRHFSNS